MDHTFVPRPVLERAEDPVDSAASMSETQVQEPARNRPESTIPPMEPMDGSALVGATVVLAIWGVIAFTIWQGDTLFRFG